jgi:plastocyanin
MLVRLEQGEIVRRENMIQRRGGIPRVSVALAVVACVVAGVSVAAAAEPVAPADQLVRATASNTWDKTALAIETGDTVTWDLAGGSATHNVQGETGPPTDPVWLAYETEYASSGRVSFTFTQPGDYEFLCGAHPAMRGAITVTGAPVEPTATPTATATATGTAQPTITPQPTTSATPVPTVRPDDRTTPAPTGSASLDRTAPAITKFSLKAVRGGATVRFTLSENAAVTIRFKKGSKTLRTARLSARAGSRAVTVRGSKLVKGRYSVEIEARDARGNRAPMARKTVRVTR